MQDNQTWRMYTSGTVLKQLRAQQKTVWAPDMRLAKDSLIYKKYKYENDDKDLKR